MRYLVLLLLPLTAACAEVSVTADGGKLRVALTEGRDTLRLGPQLFGLTFADGSRVTAADLRLAGKPAKEKDSRWTAKLAGEAATVTWSLSPPLGKHAWWRVQLQVAAAQPVVRCDVVRLEGAPAAELGGFGQPWYLGGAWFLGVEYPASHQDKDGDVLTASHAPGKAEFTSKAAILGHRGAEAQVRDAFETYLKATGRPRRSFLQYNSWYDLRGREMTVAAFAAIFREFKQHLLDPYHLRFDAFVPDDGWQNHNSIWEVDRSFLPDEYAPLARILEAGGSRLGIWMPLNGTNLSTAWGREQGYEVAETTDSHYMLTGAQYNPKIREVLKHRIEDGHLNYFNHDFNNFRTRRNHPLGPDVDFEENLDAQLAIHAYERQLAPDIFLNVTSGMWLSPWWLQQADTIWMAAGDYGFERRWPLPNPRDTEMSYRDEHFYGQYLRSDYQYPLSRLMTHGIIEGKLAPLGGPHQTVREWSDYVVLYYLRGVQLKELYVTPALPTEPMWRVLGRATQWAQAHAATLDHTRFVGGEPALGQVYGYVHWGPDEGLVAVRNPDVAPGKLSFTLAQRPARVGEKGAWQVTRIYPDNGRLPGELKGAGSIDLPAPGQSVCVYQLTRKSGAAPLVPPLAPVSGTAKLALESPMAITVTANVRPEAVDPEVEIIVKSPAVPKLLPLEGTTAQPIASPGQDNVIWRIALQPGESRFTARLQAPAALFSSSVGKLSVWLRSGVRGKLPADRANQLLPMPPTVTVNLLPEQDYSYPSTQASIGDDDLGRVKAVKLRIEVFDSNADAQYRDKQILLNGKPVARVPANPGDRFSAWLPVDIDLNPEQAGPVGRSNTLAVTNAGGDSWKCRGLALAVQRPDGVWVATPVSPRVFCSVADWLYTEGEIWSGAHSPEVTLTLPGP
ncbi:MAG: hypothetical protein HYU66_17465 [Armatimonadetes bacterium]|nr:hypothetical protein [Armatimonadota bacterium]